VRGALLGGVALRPGRRIGLVVVGDQADRPVQDIDELRVVGVVLAAALELVEARAGQLRPGAVRELVTRDDVLTQLAQPDAAEL
jgi:hypothetical protein